MADKGDGQRRSAPARQRIRTLTQAALNADVTVSQVDDVLTGLRVTLGSLNHSIEGLDTSLEKLDVTLARLNDSISTLDKLTSPLVAMVVQVETLVERFERIAGIGETLMTPIAATEHALRGAVNAVRKSTGL
jgi:ABC-type transporter Mla subunit MlaD